MVSTFPPPLRSTHCACRALRGSDPNFLHSHGRKSRDSGTEIGPRCAKVSASPVARRRSTMTEARSTRNKHTDSGGGERERERERTRENKQARSQAARGGSPHQNQKFSREGRSESHPRRRAGRGAGTSANVRRRHARAPCGAVQAIGAGGGPTPHATGFANSHRMAASQLLSSALKCS